MLWLGNRLVLILVEVGLSILNLAIAFFTNAVVFEVTTGLDFDWYKLSHAPLFWIIIAGQLLYCLISVAVQRQNRRSDDKLDKAIEKGQINLTSQAVAYSKRGDFDSAKKVIELLDELGERRHR